jgi:ATP-dependent DNA helicase RecG
MGIERVKRLLKQKEDMRLEFKEAASALPGNLFESICAMLHWPGSSSSTAKSRATPQATRS